MNLRRALLLLPLLLPSRPAAADERPRRPDVDLVSIETRFHPALELDDPTPGSFEEDARIQPRADRVRVALPWRLKTDNSMFTMGLSYERLSLALDGWPDGEPFPRGPFHSVQVPMSYVRTFDDGRRAARYFLTPGLSSDFRGTAARGFRAQGGALFERRGESGTLSFGLVFINDYGVPRAFPAVAWQGRVAERQSVIIRLPVLVSWTYAVSNRFDWGVAARVAGGNYEIGRPDEFRRRQLKYSEGTIGPFVRRGFGRWSLNLEGGYTFLHTLEVADRRHQVRDYDLERSPFAAAAVRLSL